MNQSFYDKLDTPEFSSEFRFIRQGNDDKTVDLSVHGDTPSISRTYVQTASILGTYGTDYSTRALESPRPHKMPTISTTSTPFLWRFTFFPPDFLLYYTWAFPRPHKTSPFHIWFTSLLPIVEPTILARHNSRHRSIGLAELTRIPESGIRGLTKTY